MSESAPVLTMSGISKRFGTTRALEDVSLILYPGEVHAVVGENGAGKSTLIKIMTGIYSADRGSMTLAGQKVSVSNSAEAQLLGIAAIYQEPLIFPDLSVAENIFIGHQDRGRIVNWDAMNDEAALLLAKLDLDIDPQILAASLTVASQQGVEIAKAISLDVRVLIMDEPTASLSAHEVNRLFQQVRSLRESGVAILFIGHRLEEVFEIADRITVLRDGRHISTTPTNEVTEEVLIQEMVGRDVSDFFIRTEHPIGERVLKVRSLGRQGVFEDVSFEVGEGEILGFAGLVGAGRTDVALALFGVAPADTGSIEVDGVSVRLNSPRDALALGIAYLSEDRRRLGLSVPQSVTANVTMATLKRYTSSIGLLDSIAERDDARGLVEKLRILTPSLSTPVAQLSGGNQQKTMLAKWLNVNPRILILDEPTRGIDVGAKADVHQFIDDLARSGIAIVLISSDLPEVLAMSDRVVAMREGQIRGIFGRDQATQERVMTAAVGTA